MFRSTGQYLLFAMLPSTSVALSARLPQDLSLMELGDTRIRSELMSLGGYQELGRSFAEPNIREIPVSVATEGLVEYRSEGLRARIEAQPFEHADRVEESQGNWRLDGQVLVGWSSGASHARLSRVEVVLDGAVVDLPTEAYTDVFDAPLLRDGLPYVLAARSQDGARTYLHLQAGEGTDARLITWVVQNGRYLFRVVDKAP